MITTKTLVVLKHMICENC